MLTLAAITLSLGLSRTSFDLLDGVSVEVAVHNSAAAPTTVSLSTPAGYDLEILSGSRVIWSNQTTQIPGVTIPPHKQTFLPGPSVLAVFIWNAIESDGSTPSAGDYVIRARLMSSSTPAQAQTTVHFINPVPISAVTKLPPGDVVTIAGTLSADKSVVTDASGSISLGRAINVNGNGIVAVRGYLRLQPGGKTIFYVERFALMR